MVLKVSSQDYCISITWELARNAEPQAQLPLTEPEVLRGRAGACIPISPVGDSAAHSHLTFTAQWHLVNTWGAFQPLSTWSHQGPTEPEFSESEAWASAFPYTLLS